MPAAFASKLPRATKRGRGRTPVHATPIAIRSRIAIPRSLEQRIHAQLGRRLGYAAPLIERGSVRFEDLNGPRGGIDSVCRIKLVITGRPSVQVEERAADPARAFDQAARKVRRALDRERGKHQLTSGRRARPKAKMAKTHAPTRMSTGTKRRKPKATKRLETARLPPARAKARSKARATKQRASAARGRH